MTMNNIVALLYAVSALVGSSALMLNAVTKFRSAAAKRRVEAQRLKPARKTGAEWFRDVMFFVGLVCLVSGTAGLLVMMFSLSHPATSREIGFAAMCITNVITGHLVMANTSRIDHVA